MNTQNDRVYASVMIRRYDVSASHLLHVQTPYVQPLSDNVGGHLAAGFCETWYKNRHRLLWR